jgi:hypothetical protein
VAHAEEESHRDNGQESNHDAIVWLAYSSAAQFVQTVFLGGIEIMLRFLRRA